MLPGNYVCTPAQKGQGDTLLIIATPGRLYSSQTLINREHGTVVSTPVKKYIVGKEILLLLHFSVGSYGAVAFLWSDSPVFLLASWHSCNRSPSPYAVSPVEYQEKSIQTKKYSYESLFKPN